LHRDKSGGGFLNFLTETRGHVSLNEARSHRISRDAAPGKFLGDRFREGDHAPLGSGVVSLSKAAEVPAGRRIDDRTAAGLRGVHTRVENRLFELENAAAVREDNRRVGRAGFL